MGNELTVTTSNDSGLVVTGALDISRLAKLERPQFFIPKELVVGNFGVAGMLIVDSKPEPRCVSYSNTERTGVKLFGDKMHDAAIDDNPVRRAHYFGTENGFSVIRYFVLPEQVAKFFAQDEFLGAPIIDKCCRHGTLPKEFDEEPSNLKTSPVLLTSELADLALLALREKLPEFTYKLTGESLEGHWAYVAFHPWHQFDSVIAASHRSLASAIANFDRILERHERKAELPARRELSSGIGGLVS